MKHSCSVADLNPGKTENFFLVAQPILDAHMNLKIKFTQEGGKKRVQASLSKMNGNKGVVVSQTFDTTHSLAKAVNTLRPMVGPATSYTNAACK